MHLLSKVFSFFYTVMNNSSLVVLGGVTQKPFLIHDKNVLFYRWVEIRNNLYPLFKGDFVLIAIGAPHPPMLHYATTPPFFPGTPPPRPIRLRRFPRHATVSRIPCHSAYARYYRTKPTRNRTSVK